MGDGGKVKRTGAAFHCAVVGGCIEFVLSSRVLVGDPGLEGDSGGVNETKTQVELPEAARRELEASGQQLEACAVVEGDRNFLVLIYRVDYGGEPMPESPPGVVRFSRSEHSIRVAPRILLSSPSYYRELQEKSVPPEGQAGEGRRGRHPERETRGAGIGDTMEARYQKRYDIDEFHRRFAPALVNSPVSGSAQLTYETGGCWILCTSFEPSHP